MGLVEAATLGAKPKPERIASSLTAAKSSSAKFTELTKMPASWPDLRLAIACRLIFFAVLLKKPRSCVEAHALKQARGRMTCAREHGTRASLSLSLSLCRLFSPPLVSWSLDFPEFSLSP